MLWWMLAGLASAGNIHIEAQSPFLVKVNGALVREDPTVRVVIENLDPGTHRVEICDPGGSPMAVATVSLEYDEQVFYKYADQSLDEVVDAVEEVYGEKKVVFDPLLSDSDFRDLMKKVVKGSGAKKTAHVVKRTAGYSIEIRQLDLLLASFEKREDRLSVALLVRELVRDPQNASRLDHHFGVDSDLQRVHDAYL
jgi:hypothetical protein